MIKNIVIACLFVAISHVPTAAGPQERSCSLDNPEYRTEDEKAIFSISVQCDPHQEGYRPFPTDTPLIVGLTLYAIDSPPPSPETAWGRKERKIFSKKPPARQRDRVTMTDSEYRSLDFRVKHFQIDTDTRGMKIRFESPKKIDPSYNYFVFAVWPASSQKDCDPKAKYARSGCVEFGYVIVGLKPIDVYPGLEIWKSNTDVRSEWWIAERFFP